ncbi:MAG: nucleotide exchange factor GrpE [Firmicutes bacterium]|nr:nucleotide exchange factor GrpE [Bacillota bacterium]
MKENNIFPSSDEGEKELEYTAGGEDNIGNGSEKSPPREEDSPPELEKADVGLKAEGPDDITIAENLEQKIEKLEQEKEEMKNRMLRLQADFENFRRRVRSEKADLISYANFDLMQKLLPVVDNLERALSASQGGASEGIVEGLEMIRKSFLEIMAKEGVTPIESIGKPFDPNCHEAVFREENSDFPPGTVVEELQKGYMFNDKVLRVSMVKVSAE